jgi:hypothetical protein
VPVCPVSAIFPLEDLPEKRASFTDFDAAYYKKQAPASFSDAPLA